MHTSAPMPVWTFALSAAAVVSRWLAHTGALTGLTAASTAITASILLRAPLDPTLALVAFAATASSYGIDRRVDQDRDRHALRRATLARTRGLPAVGLAMFTLAVILAVAEAGPVAAAIILTIPLAVVLYVVPWIDPLAPSPGRRSIRRIKDVPLIKAFYVAGCWLVLVPLAAVFAGRALDASLLPAAASIFGMLFVNTVACDLRDVAADRAAGIVTFPVLLGPARTVQALRVINAGWIVGLGIGLITGTLPPGAAALVVEGWIVERCLVRAAEPGADLTFYGDVCFDAAIAGLPLFFLLVALAGELP